MWQEAWPGKALLGHPRMPTTGHQGEPSPHPQNFLKRVTYPHKRGHGLGHWHGLGLLGMGSEMTRLDSWRPIGRWGGTELLLLPICCISCTARSGILLGSAQACCHSGSFWVPAAPCPRVEEAEQVGWRASLRAPAAGASARRAGRGQGLWSTSRTQPSTPRWHQAAPEETHPTPGGHTWLGLLFARWGCLNEVSHPLSSTPPGKGPGMVQHAPAAERPS